MSTATSELIAGVPLILREHPRATRLRLRFDDKSGGLLLTVPPRTSRRAALKWAADQHEWVRTQIERRPGGLPLTPGMTIPLEGTYVNLEWVEAASRRVIRGPLSLSCGGPSEGYAGRIEAWLRAEARRTLSAETADYAARAGVSVKAVSVGDADSRWGSCSSSGSIRYSWRLILMPPMARRFVVAHEVAHRVHLNHGRAFKALEAALFEDSITVARGLLRRWGPIARGVGRHG